jgi:hypothetical protein
MRFRTGLVVGLGVGYYLGAKAGRGRAEQIDRWLQRARESELMDTAAEKARAVVDLGVERARDIIDRGEESVTIEVPVHGNGAGNGINS